MALLNNPEACTKIAALYEQIQGVYEDDRLSYQSMCCDLCGAKKCVREVMGFAQEVAPKLCIYHGAAWNTVYTRFKEGYTTEHRFAKWLALQVMKEANKVKGEDHDKDSTTAPRSQAVASASCFQGDQPCQRQEMGGIGAEAGGQVGVREGDSFEEG